MPRAALEPILARVLGDGAIVSVGGPLALGAATRVIEEPPDAESLDRALATTDDGALDAAVAFAWGDGLDAPDVARALRAKVRAGGVVALASPLPPAGVGRRVLDLFARKRAVELEALCEALLIARLVDVRAMEPDGRVGVAWARVPE